MSDKSVWAGARNNGLDAGKILKTDITFYNFSPPGPDRGQSVGNAQEHIHRVQPELSAQQGDGAALHQALPSLYWLGPELKNMKFVKINDQHFSMKTAPQIGSTNTCSGLQPNLP